MTRGTWKSIDVTGMAAQRVRETLGRAGWLPLVGITRAEYWVRDGRCATVVYSHEIAGTPVQNMTITRYEHVEFERAGNGRLRAV